MQSNSNTTFTDVVNEYIQEKRATGCDFTSEAQTLRRIIELQRETDGARPCLSQGLAERWIEKTMWESEANRRNRVSVLRGLATFMARVGYEAVIIPPRIAPLMANTYTPYIFSGRELGSILNGVDQLCADSYSLHAKLVFPVVFRILIGCGTRIGETLCIEKNDLNLETGLLVLRSTPKGGVKGFWLHA